MPQKTLSRLGTFEDLRLQYFALQMISNYVAEEATFDVELVNLGLVEAILPFLKSDSASQDTKRIKREVIWTLSNVAAGNMDLKRKIG